MSKPAFSEPEPQAPRATPARHAGRLLPSLAAGIVGGLLETVFAISFGALIFGGSLAPYTAYGIGFALLSSLVGCVLIALFSSLPGSIGGAQDTPAAILTVVVAGVLAMMPAGAALNDSFLTVVATIAVTTILTGICLIVLGVFRLGNLVRFLPYPVIGGFLAGTGWLLVVGAVGLMSGRTPGPSMAAELFTPTILAHWLPGVLIALALFAALGRSSHALILPATLIGAIGLFYIWAALTGQTLDRLAADGWLFETGASGGLWQPLGWAELQRVEWGAVASQWPSIIAIILLSAIGVLLNTTGLEAVTQRDLALNRELRIAGVANLLAGLGGGIVGFQQLSLVALNWHTGARSRLVGLIAAGLCTLVFLAGPIVIGVFPKVVVGGLLLYLGLAFLKEWLLDAWPRLPRIEYAIIIGITVVIALVGFLEGVGVGVVAAILMFVVAYSRVTVVRHRLTGEHMQSRVTRLPAARQLIQAEGRGIEIFQLQGFIFFGTAESLVNQVRDRLRRTDLPQLRYVLLDFQRVTGLDSTGIRSFDKLRRAAIDHGSTLIITDATLQIRTLFERSAIAPVDRARFFETVDQGLEWWENDLLRLAGETLPSAPTTLRAQLVALAPDETGLDTLTTYLERQTVAAGAQLIAQGEQPDSLFFIESGQITAQLEYPDRPPIRLETMGSGRVIGELGFYLGQARTASVVADVPSVVYRLSRDTLERMEHQHPEAASALHRIIVRLIAERATHLIDTVSALQQ